MKIIVEKQPKSMVKLIIEVSPEKLAEYKKVVFQKLGQEMKVPGFRPGKVPDNVIEEQLGKENLRARLMQEALPLTYAEAVFKEKLEVISRPEIKIISEEPFKYEALVAVLPDVSLPDIKKINIPKKEVKVTDKDVEQVIEDLRKKERKFEETDQGLKTGDRAEVDFEGFDKEGKALPNTKSKNHPVILGEGSLVPGFEDNLMGLKKGDKKKFTVKFPKDYQHKDFQDKDITFNVEVLKTEKGVLPELNESLIEKATGKKQSLVDFKKFLEKDLLAFKKNEVERQRRDEFLLKLVEKATLEVPEGLVKEEIDFMLEDIKQNLEKQGLDFKVYEDQLKKQGKDLREQYLPGAEKKVRMRLVLSQVLKDEKIEVTDEEMDKELEKVMKMLPDKEKEEATKRLQKGNDEYTQFRNRLLLNKLFDLYL